MKSVVPTVGPREAGPPVWQTALRCQGCYSALVFYPLSLPAGKGERTQRTQASRTRTEATLPTTADHSLGLREQVWAASLQRQERRTGPLTPGSNAEASGKIGEY